MLHLTEEKERSITPSEEHMNVTLNYKKEKLMMKAMRRIVAVLLAVGMVLSFGACGSSEQSVTFQYTDIQSGITSTQTITLYAKGDTVQRVEAYNDIERTLSDLSNVDAINAQYQAAVDWLNSMVDKYNVIDGCVASVNDVGTSCRLTLTVDCTGDALSVLSAHGLMELEDSLKANRERMESDGYTVVE